jgi:hypothetical protein
VRVPADEGGDDPAVVAVRAVELLRGIRLEVRRPPPLRARQVSDRDPEAEVATRDLDAPTWRFELGAGALVARPLGAAMAFGPAVAAAGVIAPHLSITAGLAGPFFTDRPETPDGSVHTHEEMGGLGLRVDTFRPGLNLHGVATVGLHHVTATYDSRGAPPTAPPTLHVVTPQSAWNPAVTLAVGASLRLSHAIGASLQVAAIFVEPALGLVSNGRAMGTLGDPSLLTTLSAWSTLR